MVYDNGTMMLGKVEDLMKYFTKNNDILAKDILKDLEQFTNDTIVLLNFDSGYGYTLDFWTNEDLVK